jgi:hypothetical protein
MNQSERELRKKILILEEDVDAWKAWHCWNIDCKDHMCMTRATKLHSLHYRLRCLYVKLQFIREIKRKQLSV